jgi:hypothetical protein
MRHQAIYSTHPSVVSIDDTHGAYDAEGNEVAINEQLVQEELSRLQEKSEATIYQRSRAREYPPIGDQLDALWKGGEDAEEMLAKVQAVKAKYPKPE